MANKPDHYDGSDIQVLEGLEAVRKRPGILAVVEIDLVFYAIAAHLHFHLCGKGVHNGNAHAVQTARNFVSLATEFAAGVQNGEHDLDRGNLLLGMLVHGNAAAVVLTGDGIVGVDGHLDGIAVPGQGLHEIGKAKHTGTTVTFWPDPDIFTETTVYDYDTLAARFREMAFLNRGLDPSPSEGPSSGRNR